MKTKLFDKINNTDLKSLYDCLQVTNKTYKKGEFLIHQGDKITHFGMIILGNLHVIKEDFLGNKNVIASLSTDNLFAESFAIQGNELSPISVIAVEKTEVIWINYNKFKRPCVNTCPFHSQIIENLIQIIAEKNIYFNSRINCLTKTSIREKILYYVSTNADKNGFYTTSLNRNQLANFLGINRSALSRELTNLKNEGILDFDKKAFKLLVKNSTVS